MRTKVAIALIAVAFVIGGGLAIIAGRLFAFRPAGPQVGGTATVIQQIQSLSELVTVKYVLQKVVTFTNSSTTTLSQLPNVMRLPGFEEDRITLVAHGIVKAGVDLAKIEAGDVETADKRITLRLPKATVTDAYLDDSQTQVLDRKTGMFRSFENTLEHQARQYARFEMTRAARQSGIEREAEQRAQEQLKRLLQSLGFEQVEFRDR